MKMCKFSSPSWITFFVDYPGLYATGISGPLNSENNNTVQREYINLGESDVSKRRSRELSGSYVGRGETMAGTHVIAENI